MKTFEEKVKAMSAKQIIETMIEAVKNPVVKLDFDDFGSASSGKCYGCAATNTLCKISGVKFTVKSVNTVRDRAEAVNGERDFVNSFENAIDSLRCGNVTSYNRIAEIRGFAQIAYDKEVDGALPLLGNHNYLKNLEPYVRLAAKQ